MRTYFGPQHGKGPSDGSTGRVKLCLELARKSRKHLLNTPKQVADFLKENYTKCDKPDYKIQVFYVHSTNREKWAITKEDLGTIYGTQQFHSVRSTGIPYILATRKVSCHCKFCLGKNDVGCINESYVQDWDYYDVRTAKRVENVKLKHWKY
jgi:hypothetical protein